MPMSNLVWAAAPIVVYIVLLTIFKVRAQVAAPVSFACAAATAYLVFGASIPSMAVGSAQGAWNAVTIFYVIFTAMLIYEGLVAAHMFGRIRKAMEVLVQDDLLRLLFVCWGFTSFLQGITGFGVPVAVAAPILVGMGIAPVTAVVACILGHAWGGTYGTLAVAWDSLLFQADLSAGEAAAMVLPTCLMLWAYNLVCGTAICVILRGKALRPRHLLYALVISTVQGGGQLVAATINTSAACFVGASLSLLAILLLDRLSHRGKCTARLPSGELLDLTAPYLFLMALVAVLLFIPPVNRLASTFQVGPLLPDGNGTRAVYAPFSLFTHSGSLLLLTGLFTYAFYRRRAAIIQPVLPALLANTLRRAVKSIVPILFLVMMSRVMDSAGHIGILSQAASRLLGAAYPLAAPFVGILGATISSSNMSSNILFATFQKNAALQLGIDAGVILAAQTAGGSVGNLTATSNAVLGLATTGKAGQEGAVLRRLFPVCLISGAVCSAIVWLLLTL